MSSRLVEGIVEIGDVYLSVISYDPLYVREGIVTSLIDGGFGYQLTNFPSISGRHIFGKTNGAVVKNQNGKLEWFVDNPISS